ncbi:MAG: hypothetical protein R2843_07320 [Thermomicrobiales bacterium]
MVTENVRMAPDQFRGDALDCVINLKQPVFFGNLRFHRDQQQEIAQFLGRM